MYISYEFFENYTWNTKKLHWENMLHKLKEFQKLGYILWDYQQKAWKMKYEMWLVKDFGEILHMLTNFLEKHWRKKLSHKRLLVNNMRKYCENCRKLSRLDQKPWGNIQMLEDFSGYLTRNQKKLSIKLCYLGQLFSRFPPMKMEHSVKNSKI